jgi:hypothetical protein
MKKIYLLTTGICMSIAVMAQSPGGVSTGLSLWLRADAAGTLNLTGNNVNSWTYFNNSNLFTYAAGNQGTYVANSINALPGVAFNGTLMLGPTGANAPVTAGSQAYAVFAVWMTTSTNNPQRPWTQWDSITGAPSGSGTSLWIAHNGGTQNLWGDQPEIAGYYQGLGQPVNTGTFYLSEMNLLNATSNDLELLDQTNFPTPNVLSTGNTFNARANLSTVTHQLGCRTDPTDEPFTGTIEELIIYNNSVSAGASRNQIFSYLTMKYGIPFTNASNIVSSAGATVWDMTRGGAAYNNTVFGLAVDNGSSLNVQSSQASTTAGVSDAANIVLTPYDPLSTDQSFLLVGNDGGGLTEESTDMPLYASGSGRLIRNWFVQNAGSGGAVGRVNLGVDFTGVPVTGTTATDFRMMVNYSGDNTFTTTDGLYTPTSFASNVASFSGVNLPDGSVFAFITNASGATPLPVNFISFTAQANDGNVDLNWVVGNNQQASSYEVDRSSDGVNFSRVAELPNEADETSYSFVDANPGAGTHYYRILETDENGQSIYSKVVSAAIGAGDFSVAVLNNPAVGRTDAQLQINAVNPGVAYIELWTLDGKRMSLQQEAIGTGTTTISVPMSNLAPGSYVVKVMVNNNTHVTQVVKL